MGRGLVSSRPKFHSEVSPPTRMRLHEAQALRRRWHASTGWHLRLYFTDAAPSKSGICLKFWREDALLYPAVDDNEVCRPNYRGMVAPHPNCGAVVQMSCQGSSVAQIARTLGMTQIHFAERYWTLKQDGALANRARSVPAWCREHVPEFIDQDPWPPHGPNLNPLDSRCGLC